MYTRRRFLTGAGAVGLTSVAGCLGNFEIYYTGQEQPQTKWWPQPQFDGLATSYNPKQVGPRTGVSERWTLDISGPAARPVVADGLAFLPTIDAVRAVDARTGKEQWRESGDGPPLWPQVVLWDNGHLYVAQPQSPGLIALDAATGKRQWQFDADQSGVSALVIDSESSELFAGDDQGNIYKLDPVTGEQRWHRQFFGPISTFVIGTRPFLLVGTEGGEVYAVSRIDGRGYWRRKFPGQISALATMGGSYNGAGAFVSVFGGPTFGINPNQTGISVWETDVSGVESFVVAGRRVFAAGQRFVSLDLGSGKQQWSGGKTSQCGPAAAGETVYAASESEVSAYKSGGGTGIGDFRLAAKRWSYSVEGRPQQGLAVADGAVFVLTEGNDNTTPKAYALEKA